MSTVKIFAPPERKKAMGIVCTCGCEVESFDETVELDLADHDRYNQRCVSRVVYCLECAQEMERENYVLHTEDEQKQWLGILK